MEPSDRELLKSLTARVAALETKLGVAPAEKPAPKPPPPPVKAQAAEGKSAGNALGVIAGICFVLAATFLIKLAIDSGWLTPDRQVILAGCLGAALIASAFAFPESDREYAGQVAAAGVVVLYLTAYGANLYYGLFGPEAAAFAASVVSALALLLLRRFDNELIMGLAAVGTYVCPLLLPALKGGSLDSMVFYAVWDVVFLAWSIVSQKRALSMLACYLAIASFTISSPTVRWKAGQPELISAAVFQFVQFAIFLAGNVAYSVRTRKPLTTKEAWGFLPVLLFFYLSEYSLITRISPSGAPWVALAFGAAVYAAYLIAGDMLTDDKLESAPMVNAFAAVVLLHAVYFELLPDNSQPWTAVALAFGLAATARPGAAAGSAWPFGIAAMLVIGLNFLSTLLGTHKAPAGELSALNLSLAVGLLAACLAWRRTVDRGQDDLWLAALLMASTQAMAGLYRLVRLFVRGGTEPFAVTSLWAALALGLLWLAESRRDRLIARAAVVVLLIAAAKGLLVDVSQAGPVVRILCLLALGSALYFSGFLVRRTADWETPKA